MWLIGSTAFLSTAPQPPLHRSSPPPSSSSSSRVVVKLNQNRNPKLFTNLDPSFSPSRNPRLFVNLQEESLATERQSFGGGGGGVDAKVRRMVAEFEELREPIERVKRLLDYAAALPEFDESERVPANRVQGCAVQVWVWARMDECGTMRFAADSDSEITKGFCSCLVRIMDGATPAEVLTVEVQDLDALNVGEHGRKQSRVNTWHNVLIDMQKRTKVAVAEAEGKPVFDPFTRRDLKGRGRLVL